MDLIWYISLLCSSSWLSCGAPIEQSETNGSQRRSPIDVRSENIKEMVLLPLNNPFANAEFDDEPVDCTNDGSTITCAVNGSSATVFGGPFKEPYVFDLVHFHWGHSDSSGSEHMLNGQRFSSELHAVFHNKKYSTLKTARTMDDGLGVLAWFGTLSKEDNEAMNELFTTAEKLDEFDAKQNGSAGSLLGFLKELAEPLNPHVANWVYYDGALTMEPYTDRVKWILYDKLYPVSHKQLEILRHLKRKDGTPNLEHYMDVVPHSGQSVYMPKGGKFHTDESEVGQHTLS